MKRERFRDQETSDDPVVVRPWLDDYEELQRRFKESDDNRSEILREVIHAGLKATE